nr:hypothetical protein [Kibdelosporangium sp. MJ126-NF4]
MNTPAPNPHPRCDTASNYGTVVFAPEIRGPIPGVRIVIQQRFTEQEATELLDAIGGERP